MATRNMSLNKVIPNKVMVIQLDMKIVPFTDLLLCSKMYMYE
jgi:hypothetical protein